MEKQKQAKKTKEQKKTKKEKQVCPRCGSKNTYSDPRARFKHLYCNHCGYEDFGL